MNTETMNVHRALAELKVLDDRIQSKVYNATFCVSNRHSNKKINGVDLEKAKDQMKSDYQSINDLISRRDAMKRAVVKSNAQTIVQIGGRDYTVAEAIEMKNHGIDNRRALLRQLDSQYKLAVAEINRKNGEELERKLESHLTGMYGTKDKIQNEDMERTRKEFIQNNTYELVDPINAKAVIDALSNEIDTFMAEVDAALSVSNATTKVTFEYGVSE